MSCWALCLAKCIYFITELLLMWFASTPRWFYFYFSISPPSSAFLSVGLHLSFDWESVDNGPQRYQYPDPPPETVNMLPYVEGESWN